MAGKKFKNSSHLIEIEILFRQYLILTYFKCFEKTRNRCVYKKIGVNGKVKNKILSLQKELCLNSDY